MKKSLMTLGLLAAFAAPAFADTAAQPASATTASAPAAAPASDFTLTGNASLVSSYRFRGIDQTFGKPALQGGVDLSHASGLYVGNWNSNVSSGAGFPASNLEMDFYAGYKKSFGDFGVDVGAIYYYYPGSQGSQAGGISNPNSTAATNNGSANNKEAYLGVSWKFVSLKYSYSLGDYFGVPDTKGSSYIDLSSSYDLGGGWGVNGHVGRMKVKNYQTTSGASANYTDWKVGVTKDISGWVLGLSYIGTNAKGSCTAAADFYCFGNADNFANASSKKDAGRDVVVASVSKTF